MSLVCSVIFIHHAFNANILDKDYAFSDGEILMVDNAVRTHFEPYERHFKEIGFNENTIKKYLQCTNIQTVTVPVPAKFLRASNVPTGLLNEMQPKQTLLSQTLRRLNTVPKESQILSY